MRVRGGVRGREGGKEGLVLPPLLVRGCSGFIGRSLLVRWPSYGGRGQQ